MKKKVFCLALILSLIASIFCSCGSGDATEYSITFKVDGAEYSSIKTSGKVTLEMPSEPSKDGYIFDGWYLDLGVWKKSFTKDSFIDALLTENIEVYAKFTECTHIGTKDGEVCGACGKVFSCTHADADEDSECDICDEKLKEEDPEVIKYPWSDCEPVQITIQLTNATHFMQLSSGCQRYLAGEDSNAVDKIDTLIAERNDAAKRATNITPVYKYYEDEYDYAWGNCSNIMVINASSGSKDVPDIYCNFTFDILGASLCGAFHNLKSHSYNYEGANYFEFVEDGYTQKTDADGYSVGYMLDYMQSTTLNEDKTYILASDYFIDMIRASYVIPVNISLLEANGQDITGDLDGDGKFTVKDFYKEVKDGKWTYSKVIAYSAKVYDDTNKDGLKNYGDTLGVAFTSGIAATGFLYSSEIKLIEWDDFRNEYVYPDEPTQFFEVFDKISELVNSKGIAFIYSNNTGLSNRLAISEAFSENKILFGDVVLLGNLEDIHYQKLMREGGFGVAPIPLRTEPTGANKAENHTSIHNIGRAGAISKATGKFAECTAFLNYQSQYRGAYDADSNDVLLEYFGDLMYGKNVDVESAVDMLRFIRSNIGSDFEKIMEDYTSMRFETVGKCLSVDLSNSWHVLFSLNGMDLDLRFHYRELTAKKHQYSCPLITKFNSLPN